MDHNTVPVIASDLGVDAGMCHVNPDGITIGQYGLIPRDFGAVPYGTIPDVKPFGDVIQAIDRAEWQDRIAEQEREKASLTHIRDRGDNGQPIRSLDQDGYGYCWCHSATSASIMLRAVQGEPYVRLSAFFVGCLVKNYRNRGGFGGEACQFIAANGIPSVEFWPEKSADPRNDTPATRDNAREHAILEWLEVEPGNVDQYVSALLLNLPTIGDRNWWGHSTCDARVTAVDPRDPVRSLEVITWNSWTDTWGTRGMGKIQGRKALPDGIYVCRAVKASIK